MHQYFSPHIHPEYPAGERVYDLGRAQPHRDDRYHFTARRHFANPPAFCDAVFDLESADDPCSVQVTVI